MQRAIGAFIRMKRGIGRCGWSVGMDSMFGMIRRGWCGSGCLAEEGRVKRIGRMMECKKCDEEKV
jgi:hypothetical protein